jgi:hypothetical protein
VSALNKFQKDIIHAVMSQIKDAPEIDRVMIAYHIGTYLGYTGKELPPHPRVLTTHEVALQRLFFGFMEISMSVDNIRNISVYIRRFPYSNTGITRNAYLRYHMENYLNELYILSKRMETYVTMVQRMYKGNVAVSHVAEIGKDIKILVNSALKPFINIRNPHIHLPRITDHDFDMLTIFERLRTEGEQFSHLYEEIWRKVCRIKRLWIKGTNASIMKLLDHYFDFLHKLVFDSNGCVCVPAALPNKDIKKDSIKHCSQNEVLP